MWYDRIIKIWDRGAGLRAALRLFAAQRVAALRAFLSGPCRSFVKRHQRPLTFIGSPVLFFVVSFVVLNLLFPLPRHIIEKDYSRVYLDRNGELLRIALSPSHKYRIKLSLDQISPHLKKGAVYYEDRFFYYHPGVNPVSVVQAAIANFRNKRVVSGASTISMQIARMIERKPRTFSAKIIEVFRAMQLETGYGKKELLEIYLNMIPMGGNIEGVGAGAWFYFGKSARELSITESAVLIGIPNSPNRNRPDRFPAEARDQACTVLSRIHEHMGLPKTLVSEMKKKDFFVARKKNPFRCPHLVEAADPGGFFTRFTIDLTVQTFCEDLLRRNLRQNRSQGIFNGAVIVVNNKTREVIAYVGSPDYYDKDHGGQINGAAILRSPGSSLKPFLYARAVEQGLVTPGKIVYDIPIELDEYSPHNFSKSSNGLVTTAYSLVHSLNIPAVRLEDRMKERGLKGLLKELFPRKKDLLLDESGLSLVLGGFAMTLEEMTALYMMLARDGLHSPLRFQMKSAAPGAAAEIASKRLLSDRACYIVSEILSRCHRPDLPYSWEFSPHHARAALKTGTSFGLKDAVCFGYNPDYTIGVWQGNVNNRGSSHLIGVRKAAPLVMEIFNYLTRNSDSWFVKPKGIAERKVCPVTGLKPGSFCGPYFKKDLFLPGISSEKQCRVHRRIRIAKKGNFQVCSNCLKRDDSGKDSLYREEVVEYWPAEVVSFLRKTGRKYSSIPGHNPACERFFVKDKPRIISPSAAARYEIDETLPLESQKIPLKAFIAQDAHRVYWFLGSRLIGEGDVDEAFFLAPRRGEFIISAIDSKGRSDSVTIRVH
ncbi:MAG: penicillin-binding protein 1C [bacterium]|nr:penicillin-binding protein 1C [bacterium]